MVHVAWNQCKYVHILTSLYIAKYWLTVIHKLPHIPVVPFKYIYACTM